MSAEEFTETPLAPAQLEQFNRDGYIVVRDVLDAPVVAELRSFLTPLFDKGTVHPGDVQFPPKEGVRGGGVRHDVWSRYPELRVTMTQPRVLGALRSLLGDDFVVLPETVAHDSRYGGWHKDTTPLERAGVDFHKDPEFAMLECAYYLQDNDEYGGGLDVVPGSHTEEDVTPAAPKVTFLDKVAYKLGRPRYKANDVFAREGALSIPSRAGDLIAFDLRLDHMATQPLQRSLKDIPDSRRKLAIFFIAAANNDATRRYREWQGQQYEHLRDGHDYPAELLELAEQHQLTLI